MSFILASSSPRRKEILAKILPFEFEIISSSIDEGLVKFNDPFRSAEVIAQAKLLSLLKDHEEDTILCADTVVLDGTKMLGKPKDIAHAKRMLLQLSGHEHLVITGYSLYHNGAIYTSSVRSKVFIDHMSEEQLDTYLQTGSPLDKAGSYGIQDELVPARLLEGSYDSVMGLPKSEISALLTHLGIISLQ